MKSPAAVAYEAYIRGRGQEMRKAPGKPRKGGYGSTSPKGARLWEELPPDEKRGWWAAVAALANGGVPYGDG